MRPPWLGLCALALTACAHAPAGDLHERVAPGVDSDPAHVLLTVAWETPSQEFAVACGDDLFDGRQHWLRGSSADGTLTERFVIQAGAGKVQCLVADEAAFKTTWAIFEDHYTCPAGSRLRLDLRVSRLGGQLAFDTAYSAERCTRFPAEPAVMRRLVGQRQDPPPRVCCGVHTDDFRPE